MIIPFAEWLPDQPTLEGGGAKIAKNVIPAANSYLPFPGPEVASDALDSTPRGSIALRESDDDVKIFAGDQNKLYQLVDGSFTDVSKSGGYVTDNLFWEFQRWGDKVIAVTKGEPPQIIDMTTGGNFADLGGTPPEARHIAVVRDFVVLGNLVESGTPYANKLRWSGINDETDWAPSAATQSDSQILQGDGGFIQAIVGGEYGVIIQDNSIWRMTYVGPPVVFQFDEVETGRGTNAPNSVVSLGSMVFYLGKDGFYVFDGNSSKNISANKVSDYFYDDLDVSYQQDITAAIDPKNTLVIWNYHSIANTGTPDKQIIFNWTTGRWSFAENDLIQVNYSRQSAYTLDSMDTVLASIDDPAPSFDSRFWKGGAILLSGFNTDNKMVVFTGDALSGVIETDEKQLSPGMRSLVTGIRPLV
ncbi:MAG: hypothetical protein VYB22_11065, partial [Pseudomonadota bacterium]|nr:hypothetical protein [Pseudomonadota bacterium]